MFGLDIKAMKGIMKWIAIAAAISLLGAVFVSVVGAYQDQGKLAAAEANEQATIERTNKEVAMANANTAVAVKAKRESDANVKRKTDEKNKMLRRALYAERELGKLVSSGDVDAINFRLCETFDRIEGNDIDGRKERCAAYITTGDASRVFFRIGKQSVENNLANWGRAAVSLEQCLLENEDVEN